MALRVLLADDNYLVREGLSALLSEADGLEVVGAVADPEALLAQVAAEQPDAVLTDIRMPPTFTAEGIEAARRIRAEHPSIGVVVLSQYVEGDDPYELLKDGVAGVGYLLKERVSDLDELVRALTEVARGGSVLDPRVVEGLMARTAGGPRSPLQELTEREQEVLAAMATGKTNGSIARSLYMSERAVEKHIGAVFTKLGLGEEADVNRRVVAVLTYLDATARSG